MINRVLLVLLVCVSVFSIYSCSDDTDSQINGQWQLRSVNDNGSVTNVDTLFYSFQRGKLFVLTNLPLSVPGAAYLSFGYVDFMTDNKFSISMDTTRNEDGYFRIIEQDFLGIAGWEYYVKEFTVESIDGKYMTLSSGQKVYSFKKH